MKNSEIARYWAAKELTRIDKDESGVKFGPLRVSGFTVKAAGDAGPG